MRVETGKRHAWEHELRDVGRDRQMFRNSRVPDFDRIVNVLAQPAARQTLPPAAETRYAGGWNRKPISAGCEQAHRRFHVVILISNRYRPWTSPAS
jgi:hypothetical protein